MHVKPLANLTILLLMLLGIGHAHAGETALPGTVTVATPHSFDRLLQRLEQAIANQKMGLVAMASASRGAASRGVSIPGNAVVMVYRNDYAVRMLAASVPAGFEAPLRIYVTEGKEGTASLTYRRPSAVFAPYSNAEIDAMAGELDPIFAAIVADAATP
jgi:uncharacterized protein (DUF302 family)